MHLFTVSLGNAFGDNALIKATDQLLNRLTITSFYFHMRWTAIDEKNRPRQLVAAEMTFRSVPP